MKHFHSQKINGTLNCTVDLEIPINKGVFLGVFEKLVKSFCFFFLAAHSAFLSVFSSLTIFQLL